MIIRHVWIPFRSSRRGTYYILQIVPEFGATGCGSMVFSRMKTRSVTLALLYLVSPAFSQVLPPIDHVIRCEDLNNLFGGDLRTLGRPQWSSVINQRSDYWVIETSRTQFGQTGSVQSTVVALFDPQGHIVAQDQYFENTNFSALVFGSFWQTGWPGSPIMLTPGQTYYLGIAGGGSVFHDGFLCDLSADRGRFSGFAQPTPGTIAVLLIGGVACSRRRRY